jgi:hypothetical protein
MWVMRREPSRRRAGLDDDVDRADDHFADGRGWFWGSEKPPMVIIDSRRLRLRAAVGVQRAHRAVVARCSSPAAGRTLRAADFADDDAFGAHTQAVLDEIAHGDLALAFEVGRARFEAHHMRLLQLQFGGVLAGDDALVGSMIGGQAVEQRRLARAGAAGDQDVAAARGR